MNIKKTDVVILNWQRPENIKKYILPPLIDCKYINKIIISHGRIDTYFEYNNEKVISLDHSKLNKIYGLALRFVCNEYITSESILILDDDLIIDTKLIEDLIINYNNKPNFIHGYYGRIVSNNLISYGNINEKNPIKNLFMLFPDIYRKNKKLVIKSNWYSYKPKNFLKFNNKLKNNIALTKLMIIPRECYNLFMEYFNKINPYMLKNSKPFWNGEDIVINLLWIKNTGKEAIIHNPYKKIIDKGQDKYGVSSNLGHDYYRIKCVNYLCNLLDIKF